MRITYVVGVTIGPSPKNFARRPYVRKTNDDHDGGGKEDGEDVDEGARMR